MKSKIRKVAAITALFTVMAATFTFANLLISDKNGAYANDGRTVLSNEEQLFPEATITEFTSSYATDQDKMLYSRIGLEKDGVNVLDITRGKTEKHQSVIVVIDSGVKYDHPEFLDENGKTRLSERSFSVGTKTTVKQSGWGILNDVEVTGSSYHGTQVCGSIFASHTNNTGFYGLADEAELVFVKIPFNPNGGYSSEDVLTALDYAISLKPDVVNMSMGNYISSNYFGSRLRQLRSQGTVVIAAAGNSPRSDSHYPSADSSVVGVGAFDNLKNLAADVASYNIASYSSFGDTNVDICAPGRFWQTYTDKDGNALYTESNGTSVAAPVVSAAVALYKSLYPEATPDEVIEKLYSSARDHGDLGKDYYFGYGGLDIYNFIFGNSGEVTFDYNNGTSVTMPITEGVALKEYPFPSGNSLGKTFGGWYLDLACTQPVNYYSEVLASGATVYAKWTDEETTGAYDYTLERNGNSFVGVIKGYYGNLERITVPSEITVDGKTYPVKTIAARAFQNCGAKKIIIPEGVTRLDEYSLANNNLEFVWVPSTVNSVRLYAFASAKGNLYLQGEDLTKNTDNYFIGKYNTATWDYAATLNIVAQAGDYSYENGVEVIGETLLCFDGSGELLSGAKYISDSAAANNKNLIKAVLPNATQIGFGAFKNCTQLISLEIPSAEIIGERAFQDCKGLTDVAFSSNLTEISDHAFYNCTSLTELDFSECTALSSIGMSAFRACEQLKIIDLQGATSLKSLGVIAFQDCTSLFSVSLPDSLNNVGSRAFNGCNSITVLKIPFVGMASSNNRYTHLGIIFGASISDTQASYVPSTLKYVYVTGTAAINSSALHNLSGITVFANGTFSGETDCTVYTQGNFSLLEIYAEGKLCGMYGGSPSAAVDETALNASYTVPHGLNAQGVEGVPTNLPDAGVTALELSTSPKNPVTVKFFNYNGELLSEAQYSYGEEIVFPQTPEKASTAQYQYVFTGWDKQLSKAIADVDYTAEFKEVLRSYEIKFLDSDGRVLKALLMEYGATPEAPKVSDKAIDEVYYNKFVGWDKQSASVTEQTEYVAQYTQTLVEYVITFVYADNNAVFAEQKYHYGDTITPPDTARADDIIFSYTFSKWSAEFDTVTGNAQYSAEYDKTFIEYLVVFKNYDGTVLSSETYHYGDTPIAPAIPERPSDDNFDYTFSGWDKKVTAVNGNAEYIAQYTSRSNNSFIITFIVDNEVISSKEYERGAKIEIPADPEKKVSVTTYYYVFEGWTPQVSGTAVADAEYTAVFARMVSIKFLDYDGSIISEKEYRHNSDVTVPTAPEREAEDGDICKYVFDGWNKTVSLKASASAEYTAVYKEVPHNFEQSGSKAATCTENGFTEYTCTECGKTYSESIPATGHTPGDWIVDKEATKEEEGHRYKECTVCHEKLEEETIPKLPEEEKPDNPPNNEDPPEQVPPAVGGGSGCNGCNSTTDGGSIGGNIFMISACLALLGLIPFVRKIRKHKSD